jgi:hypothetical protein
VCGLGFRLGEGLGGAHLTYEGPIPSIKAYNQGLG